MEILCKNFPKSQTWNWIFFQLSKKNRECSKISHIYLLWTSSERSLSKIRGPFFPKKRPLLEGVFDKKFQKFPKFSTWNWIFFQLSKKSLECSKKSQIYLLWTSSEPILSKIRAPFFSKKKASVVVWIWKKNPKISEFFNLKSDFSLILQKKWRMFQN